VDVKVVGPNPQDAAAVHALNQPILGMPESEFAALAASVMIAVPHRPSEGVHPGIAMAAGLWARCSTPISYVEDQFAGNIAELRMGIVRAFLEYARFNPQVQYLVMIDSDESVQWDAPYRLAAWGEDIVTGVVCSYNRSRGIFACITLKDRYGIPRFPSLNFTRKMPSRGLIEIAGCGAGLLCIKKSVLEKFAESGEIPFYIPEESRKACWETGTLKIGEDIAFTKAAERLGFKLYADLSVRAQHFKTVCVEWPEHALDHEMNPQEWQVDARDYAHHG
jgi:hypothetical protein